MIHVIYCFIIFILIIAIFFQCQTTDLHQKRAAALLEKNRKLTSRLHDVINEYRRDRGIETVSWTEFKELDDPTLFLAIPPGIPVKNKPVPFPFGIEPKKRPSHADASNARVTSKRSTTPSSSSSTSSSRSSQVCDSGSYSSSSDSSSSSCDSGSSSSSSSCD